MATNSPKNQSSAQADSPLIASQIPDTVPRDDDEDRVSDDRLRGPSLTSSPGADRLSRDRDAGADRSDRQHQAYDGGNRDIDLMSDEELAQMVRSEFVQEALPQIQAPHGWHYCWLSSTSSYDPIHKRIRIGYVPVQYAELTDRGFVGYEQLRAEGGSYDGCVKCNEMVLFKLPQRVYQVLMAELHHHQPLAEEKSLRQRVENPSNIEREDSSGKQLFQLDETDEVFRTLGRSVRPPQSFA